MLDKYTYMSTIHFCLATLPRRMCTLFANILTSVIVS